MRAESLWQLEILLLCRHSRLCPLSAFRDCFRQINRCAPLRYFCTCQKRLFSSPGGGLRHSGNGRNRVNSSCKPSRTALKKAVFSLVRPVQSDVPICFYQFKTATLKPKWQRGEAKSRRRARHSGFRRAIIPCKKSCFRRRTTAFYRKTYFKRTGCCGSSNSFVAATVAINHAESPSVPSFPFFLQPCNLQLLFRDTYGKGAARV